MEFLVWVLMCYGTQNILTNGKIFDAGKDWLEKRASRVSLMLLEMLDCPMCCGTWVGFAMSLAWSPTVACFNAPFALNVFLDGMISSACCWLISLAAGDRD